MSGPIPICIIVAAEPFVGKVGNDIIDIGPVRPILATSESRWPIQFEAIDT